MELQVGLEYPSGPDLSPGELTQSCKSKQDLALGADLLDLGLGKRAGDVLLVGQDKQRCAREPLLLQQAVQLISAVLLMQPVVDTQDSLNFTSRL